MEKATSVIYAEKVLKCDHCGNEEFVVSKKLLTSRFMLDFLPAVITPSATVFACTKCTKMHWFGGTPQSVSKKTSCIRCNTEISTDADICPACGAQFS